MPGAVAGGTAVGAAGARLSLSEAIFLLC